MSLLKRFSSSLALVPIIHNVMMFFILANCNPIHLPISFTMTQSECTLSNESGLAHSKHSIHRCCNICCHVSPYLFSPAVRYSVSLVLAWLPEQISATFCSLRKFSATNTFYSISLNTPRMASFCGSPNLSECIFSEDVLWAFC